MSHKPIAVFAGLVAGVALVIAFTLAGEFPPRFDSELHQEIGRALAKEVSELAPNGAQVTLITRDTSVFKQPALDLLAASFKKELSRTKGTLSATHPLQVDPLRPLEAPAGDFFELIRKAAPGSVIVSLMGPPLLSPEQRTRLGAINAKIIAFCPGSLIESIDLRALFDAHLLNAAIVSRLRWPAGQPNPHTYDQLYATVTPANLSTAGGSGTAPP